MKVEKAVREKNRAFPEWLHNAIERERAELASITDPVRRRVAELELDQIETRVKSEMTGTL